MLQDPSHPAIAAARTAIGDAFAERYAPTAVVVRERTAAVVLDSRDHRCTVIVEQHDGVWTVAERIAGGHRPAGPRAARTDSVSPLKGLSRRDFSLPGATDIYWFAITGIAADDAVAVSVVSRLEEFSAPIGTDGLVFALTRARSTERPTVRIHTGDGRIVPVTLPEADIDCGTGVLGNEKPLTCNSS